MIRHEHSPTQLVNETPIFESYVHIYKLTTNAMVTDEQSSMMYDSHRQSLRSTEVSRSQGVTARRFLTSIAYSC